MLSKVIAIIMCASACSAQLSAECAEIETIYRGEPICAPEPIYRAAEPVYRAQPVFRPAYRCLDDDFEPEIVQQRVDSRTYPIVVSNNPQDNALPPVIQAPQIVAPVHERPVIRLPHPPIPPPRVVSHKCLCTKTVVKPQIVQRVITVPKIQRYLRRGYRPVVENIAYAARARNPDNLEAPISRIVAEPVPIRGPPILPPLSQISSIC